MVVRLQTADGEIKDYQTTYVVGEMIGDRYYPEKWIANCGLEWKNKPKEHEECDHLDCACTQQKNSGNLTKRLHALFL